MRLNRAAWPILPSAVSCFRLCDFLLILGVRGVECDMLGVVILLPIVSLVA